MRTLIIVPKTSLIDQWKNSLGQFLRIEDDRPPLLTKTGKPSKRKRPVIGQIGRGKNAPDGIVDIATYQSLSIKNDLGVPCAKPIVEDYELVICDECHYGAAPNLELIMKSTKARRVYGLSATPERSDGLEKIVFMHCGPIRYRIDPKTQAAEQSFRRILYPHFTRVRFADLEPGASFCQVIDSLCVHEARNAQIAEDAIKLVQDGRTPIIITQRKGHASDLANLLMDAHIETYLLTGDGTTREKREKLNEVRAAATGHFAIVATGSYAGEGFDLPQLDTLLFASPYSWKGVITQYSGRLHREFEGKSEVVVYDYIDTSVPMLERMYKKRLKTYLKLGYEICAVHETEGPGARLLNCETWIAAFRADIENATKYVAISTHRVNKKTINLILDALRTARTRGIEIVITLKKAKSERAALGQAAAMELLEDAGCTVTIEESTLTGIAIFDDKITWYGTLPLLAAPANDDCSLRAESAEIATDLKSVLPAILSASSSLS